MTFWTFFRKTKHEYKWVSWWCQSQFSTHFIYKNDKNLYFSYENKPLSTQNKWEIIILIYFDTAFTCICKKIIIFKISCMIYMTNCEAMTHLNIHKDGQEIMWNFKMSQLPYFLIFIIFAPICREIFTLSLKLWYGLDFPFNKVKKMVVMPFVPNGYISTSSLWNVSMKQKTNTTKKKILLDNVFYLENVNMAWNCEYVNICDVN